MSCEDFETIVSGLADSKPMDATARITGLAHVATCGYCAARLQDAKGLSTGLQMAAAAETEETPARVRESLLAAFAEHHNVTAPMALPTVTKQVSTWRTARWWSVAAVAAAAVIILALLLPSLVRLAAPAPPTESADAKGVKEPAPARTDAAPPKQADGLTTPGPERKGVVATNTLPLEPKRKPTLLRKIRPSDRSNTAAGETAANDTAKGGSQYFPLTYLASSTAMESGTVVRIQVSRSKLISLGLPINGERADEVVKADLVLGDDGVARAIRLVE